MPDRRHYGQVNAADENGRPAEAFLRGWRVAVGFLGRIVLLAGCLLAFATAASGDGRMLPEDPEAGNGEDKIDGAFYDENLDFLEEDSGPIVLVADPLEPWNRAMLQVNDRLYFWVLKPAAQGYNFVLPWFVRLGIKNFFINVVAPERIVNCLLQAKSEAAHSEWVRFLGNTTFGILGFVDLAANEPDLALRDEDLGQSLAVYGVGNGAYLVWPLIGPSTVRDTIGKIGDAFLRPTFYIEPFWASAGVWAFDKVNETSFRIGDYEALKEASIEPYEAFRNGYMQLRNSKIER